MKLIYRTLIALLSMSVMFISCNDEKPFSVAGPNDEPHVLAPTFADRNNGELPTVATINRDANFSMTLTVTPADFVEVDWYLDGNKVASGKKIDMPLLAGVYNMKVVVTTTLGKTTFREGIVRVNPLDVDPSATKVSFERFIAPGAQAVLYGKNLDQVKGLKVGNIAVTSMTVVPDNGGAYISYTVPAGVPEGKQRVVLIGTNDVEYGGDVVTVSSAALVTSGADRATANATCVMTGINLDKVASLDFGGTAVSNFAVKTVSRLEFTCPSLNDGEYTLTGKMTDGKEVTFFTNKEVVNNTKIIISSEQTLWSGHHYVSWDLPDGNPNKAFNLIGQSVFASIKPGAVMSIHYSIEPTATYHQIRTTSGWWGDLPGTGTVDVATAGVLNVTLTQAVLDMIKDQSGFLCVGHGYFVDLITVK
jgi:hypothetical protein